MERRLSIDPVVKETIYIDLDYIDPLNINSDSLNEKTLKDEFFFRSTDSWRENKIMILTFLLLVVSVWI